MAWTLTGARCRAKQFALVDIGYVYDGVLSEHRNFGYNGNGIPITTNTRRK